jgi:hypothetical protein
MQVPRRKRMRRKPPTAMPILAPRVSGPEGGVKEDAIVEAEEKGEETLTRVLEEKTSPSMPMRAPLPGLCWQLALRVVKTENGLLATLG